jgi:hypothetical protein
VALNESEDTSASMVASDSHDVNGSNGSAPMNKPKEQKVVHGFGPGVFSEG